MTAPQKPRLKTVMRQAGSIAILVLLVMAITRSALACSFHTYKPAKTLVDRILESQALVLARQSKKTAFRFKITSVLKGDVKDPEIPFLVDTTTRHRLEKNAQDSILFALNGKGDWRYLSYIDADRKRLLDMVLQQAGMWRSQTHHPDRLEKLSIYLNHSNLDLHNLALQEIDRVPYETLSALKVSVPVERLLTSLKSARDYQYEPINTLLLGLSRTPEAGQYLRQQIARMRQNLPSRSLGAVATALIEVEREHGIQHLDRLFLADRNQPMDKVETVVEAMAIHSKLGSHQLRRTIDQTLIGFVRRRPAGAGAVARQFSAHRNWFIGPQLESMLESGTQLTPATRLQVAIYIAQSKASRN